MTVPSLPAPPLPIRRVARLGALAVLGWAAATAQAGCRLETLELPVKMVGSRAVANVTINGTPVPLTVDSGAFFSILTEAAAAQLKLPLARRFGLRVQGITGPVDADTTQVDELRFLNGKLEHVDFFVGGNEPGAGTMGLLGRNLLSFADTEYDLAHGMIRFHFPKGDCAEADMAYWAGETPVAQVELESRIRGEKLPPIRVRVRLNGHEALAVLDTGANTLVTAKAARRAGLPEDAAGRIGSVYGAGRGSAKAWTAPVETFEIGGETVNHNHLHVADFSLDDADMLLGIDFFLSHRIYMSKRQSKLFFTYDGGPVFALDRAGARHAAEAAASGADPANADGFARRGAALAARGNLEAALADLDRACELDPASATLLAQRGQIRQALKRLPEAVDDFDKALALDPSQVEARTQRAWLRFQSKDRDGAGADLDALDKATPPQAQIRLWMSEIYARLDRPTQALSQLDQWLPAHPHELRRDAALNRRCWLRARLGIELTAALDDCNEAVDADAKNPTYVDSRGWILLRLGRYGKALSDFDRALELRPGAAWSLYGRGLTKARMGEADEGEADLAAARKQQPDIDARVTRAGLAGAAAR